MITIKNLAARWQELKKEQPQLRIRNAAQELGVSEMELIATNIGSGVTRLRPEMKEILSEIESLGKVMALSRNEECVHERKGVYLNADFSNSHAGLFVGDDIDLRIFLSHWKKVFSVVEETARGISKSIQFFGKDGEAIHKIYLTPDSNEAAFYALIEKYKHENQSLEESTESIEKNVVEKAVNQIDVKAFQQGWIDLKDTHDFFGLLNNFGVTRTQAMRLAPSDFYAKEVSKDVIVDMLITVAKEKTPIMVFTGNRGIIQIHTGIIRKTMWFKEWYNVMDPDFNMHLDMSKISETWIVRKPTEDGIVTSIEAFNDKGEVIVQFFGKRKLGSSELVTWSETINKLS